MLGCQITLLKQASLQLAQSLGSLRVVSTTGFFQELMKENEYEAVREELDSLQKLLCRNIHCHADARWSKKTHGTL